jgi:hypothetical protein
MSDNTSVIAARISDKIEFRPAAKK